MSANNYEQGLDEIMETANTRINALLAELESKKDDYHREQNSRISADIRVKKLESVLRETDEYLSKSLYNSINFTAILHAKLNSALNLGDDT